MKIEVSAFKVSSSDKETISKCQDSFSVNTQTATFAVADGVSQSLYPDIWAEILTKNYTDSPNDFFVSDDNNNKILTGILSDKYNEAFQKRYDSLLPQEQRNVKVKRIKTPYPAATFVGVKINNDEIIVECIGDSVLFHIDKTGIHSVCSMPHGEDGKIHFDNRPQYLTLDTKNQNGIVKTQDIPFAECTLLVMTDALAEWFDKLDNFAGTAIEKLKELSNHNQFSEFVFDLRKKRQLKDDDTTLLVIKITEDGSKAIKCVAKHIDDINALKLGEITEEKNAIKKDLQQQKDKAKDFEIRLQESETERNRLLELSKQQVQELSTLEKIKDSLSLQTKDLTQTNKVLSDKIKTLESSNDAMKSENENHKTKLQALESKVKIMADKLEKAEQFRLSISIFLKEEFKV